MISSAEETIDLLRTAGLTIAVAESLTGGALCSALVAVPGASDALQGGVVAYTAEAKQSVLGVDPVLLSEKGTVDGAVAEAMAAGARRLFGAKVGAATTGVAGPGSAEGKPAGTVYICVSTEEVTRVRKYTFDGGRQDVRAQTVAAALDAVVSVLRVVT